MVAFTPRRSLAAAALVLLLAQLNVGVEAASNSSDHGGRKLAAHKPARSRSRARFRSGHRSRTAQADTGAASDSKHQRGQSSKQGEHQTPMRRPDKGRPYHHHKKAHKPAAKPKQPDFYDSFHVDMRTYTPSTPEEKEEENQIWARFRAEETERRQTGASCLDYQDYLKRLNEECEALTKVNDQIQDTMMNDLMALPINEPVKLLPAANLIDFSTDLYGKCVQEKDKYLDGMKESCMGSQEKAAQDAFIELGTLGSL